MDDEIRRAREDHYFQKHEQKQLDELRRSAAREAEALRLMNAMGITDRDLVRELTDAGFDAETFRLLYLVPLVQVAWSDGKVSRREKEAILEIAGLHGVGAGDPAHERLSGWLAERPSEQFFHACLRGVKAMLRERPASGAEPSHHDLFSYCTRIASASGGILGLGSVSREEEQLLERLATELDARNHAAVTHVTEELEG